MASPASRDPITAVLPVRNLGDAAGKYFAKWLTGLAHLGREFSLVIVDDGSTDSTAAAAQAVAAANPNATIVRHDSPQGFGACIRTALPHATHPLLLYAATDYPYEPGDVRKLLDVFGTADEYSGLTVRVVNGCRAGRPKPAPWALGGRLVRGLCRYVLGNPVEPYPGWLGFKNHAYAWVAWLVFGDPFVDPNSGLKLFDRALLDRFPIQSDGNFVHTELVGKVTFLTTLMSEVSLTPKPDPVPTYRMGRDLWTVYRKPKFVHPEPEAHGTPDLEFATPTLPAA
jgi:glycosyltransferase involved in cell wall biosynthesis